MQNIIDYSIIIEEKSDTLIEQVNIFIKRGWQPLGGIVTAVRPGSYKLHLLQTIVNYEEEK